MGFTLSLLFTGLLVGIQSSGQGQAATEAGQLTMAAFAQEAAVRAMTFQQGDIKSLSRARADFTPAAWNDFLSRMKGDLDAKGAPGFNSRFVPSGQALVVEENEGRVHLRIPGTLTQSSTTSSTAYRAALDIRAGGKPMKIERLEPIMCAGASTECE